MAVSQTAKMSVSLRGLYEAFAFLSPIVLFGLLAAIRIAVFAQTGSLVALLNAVALTVLVSMFVVRRPAREVDRSFSALVAALLGNFLPFCFILTNRNYFAGQLPAAIEVVTIALAIWTVLSLRASMGITPANRGIKTGGPYRIVRHPLYTLVVISQLGLLLAYPLPFNFLVLGIAVAFKAKMVLNEERVLQRDPAYLAYMERVRYRAIPGIV